MFCCGTTREEDTLERNSDRDHWFTAEEALQYGMIDEVLTKK